MEKNDCYVGLELGTSSIKCVVGFVLNEQIHVLTTVEELCSSLADGLIMDQDLTTNTIKKVLQIASKNSGFEIKEVCLSLPPYSLHCMSDIGSTNTIDGNDIIHHIDTSNILTSMKKRVLADQNLQIIDIVPDVYMLDNNEKFVIEPIGKVSKSLSLHAAIYAMSNKVITSFVSAVRRAGYQVKHVVASPYAACLALATNKSIPNSYFLVDIGYSVTTIALIDHSTTVSNCRITKFGGYEISRAIAERFSIPLDDAEKLKVTYGIDNDLNFACEVYPNITLDDLSETITRKLISLCETIQKTMREFTDNDQIPIVITGGTASLNNIKKVFAEALNVDIINYPLMNIGARKYNLINTLGLIKYWAIQPVVNEEDTITTSISRVNNNTSRNYNFDDEL